MIHRTCNIVGASPRGNYTQLDQPSPCIVPVEVGSEELWFRADAGVSSKRFAPPISAEAVFFELDLKLQDPTGPGGPHNVLVPSA